MILIFTIGMVCLLVGYFLGWEHGRLEFTEEVENKDNDI